VLICDEVTSALDVSVQAAIVELLARCSAISPRDAFRDAQPALVRSIAQRVAVMSHGRIIELGRSTRSSKPPGPYTRRLLADTPSLEVAVESAESS